MNQNGCAYLEKYTLTAEAAKYFTIGENKLQLAENPTATGYYRQQP